MDGKEDQKAAALKKADEARKRADTLREQSEKRKAEESAASPGGSQ